MTTINIDAIIEKNVEKVWSDYNDPEAIRKWNQASDDWYCPKAENDLKVGGKFSYTMAAKDGSDSFDFEGVYTKIEDLKLIEYTLTDGRRVEIDFDSVDNNSTIVTIDFETEEVNSVDQQREGWEAILLNFKKFCEGTV